MKMSNWCSNIINITGSPDKLEVIKKVIQSIEDQNHTVVFSKLVGDDPISPELSEKESNIELWGTQFDVSFNECSFIFDVDRIQMSPDTAWSPPVNFCKTLSKEYGVKVDMLFFEPGQDYCGQLLIEDGYITQELDYSYYEGLYNLSTIIFWDQLEIRLRNLDLSGNVTVEMYIQMDFPFMSEQDKETAITLYHKLNEKKDVEEKS